MEHYGSGAHDAIINRILGYSKKDWQRALTLPCYLRMFWNRPSIRYGQKRKQDFFRQYWASHERGEMLQKVKTRKKEVLDERRDPMGRTFRKGHVTKFCIYLCTLRYGAPLNASLAAVISLRNVPRRLIALTTWLFFTSHESRALLGTSNIIFSSVSDVVWNPV